MNISLTQNSWGRKLAASLCVAGVAAVASFSSFALGMGENFPDLNKYGLEGNLPELKGKVVLVDFFASWCAPCKASFPAMQELHEKYKDKGVVILAVNVDKKRGDMEKFLKNYPCDFPVLRDGAAKLVSEVKVSTMPSSFLLDKNGKVTAVHTGFHGDETKRKYVEEIETLLK